MKLPIFLTIALAIAAPSCSRPAAPPDAGASGDGIYTTFYPVTYLTERIAGGLVPVTCPLPDATDPASWQPSRSTLAAYQSADLVIANGAGFERWLATASLSPGRLIDSSAALIPDLLRYEDVTVHRHGPAGEHSHEGIDGHTWLDPHNAKTQAAAILEALAARWPAHAEAFADNAAALASDLDALDTRLRALERPPLLASHPAYNYLVERYGWNLHSLDLDPGLMPDAALFKKLSTQPGERLPNVILWESQPLPEIAARLRDELGLRSIVFSPCESAPPGGADYLAVMNANIDRLIAAFDSN